MKLLDANQEAEGALESISYTFEANAASFRIVAASLYTEKEAAVAREIISNAYDSHTQAGAIATKIDVHVPSLFEPFFSVRDYGVGLSHENMLELYTTFFASNRRDSNSGIGGFGLGSKSPFAVSESFEVTSWYDGVRSDYVSFMDAGIPQFSRVASSNSNEPNGVLVTVPVDTSVFDVNNFKRTTVEMHHGIARCGGAGVNLLQGTMPPAAKPATTYVLPNGAVVEKYGKYQLARTRSIAVGPATYSLPDGQEWSAFDNTLVTVPIGSVSLAPSREQLSLDPVTKSYLRGLLTEFMAVRDIEVSSLCGSALWPVPETRARRIHVGKEARGFPGQLYEVERYGRSRVSKAFQVANPKVTNIVVFGSPASKAKMGALAAIVRDRTPQALLSTLARYAPDYAPAPQNLVARDSINVYVYKGEPQFERRVMSLMQPQLVLRLSAFEPAPVPKVSRALPSSFKVYDFNACVYKQASKADYWVTAAQLKAIQAAGLTRGYHITAYAVPTVREAKAAGLAPDTNVVHQLMKMQAAVVLLQQSESAKAAAVMRLCRARSAYLVGAMPEMYSSASLTAATAELKSAVGAYDEYLLVSTTNIEAKIASYMDKLRDSVFTWIDYHGIIKNVKLQPIENILKEL